MKAVLTVAAAAAMLAAVGSALAQDRGDILRADLPGRVIFERQCAPCHGTGRGDDNSPQLPGTAALAARYAGAKPGELELRTDLNADVLRFFVRRGIGPMPAFRQAELSDADIDAIAAYIASTARQ